MAESNIRTSLTVPRSVMVRIEALKDRLGHVTTADTIRMLLMDAIQREEGKAR